MSNAARFPLGVLAFAALVRGEGSTLALERRIARMEGFYVVGTIAREYNNPGLLVFAGQPGARRGTAKAGRWPYARFETAQAGWAALRNDLKAKRTALQCLSTAWVYLTCDGQPRKPAGAPP